MQKPDTKLEFHKEAFRLIFSKNNYMEIDDDFGGMISKATREALRFYNIETQMIMPLSIDCLVYQGHVSFQASCDAIIIYNPGYSHTKIESESRKIEWFWNRKFKNRYMIFNSDFISKPYEPLNIGGVNPKKYKPGQVIRYSDNISDIQKKYLN